MELDILFSSLTSTVSFISFLESDVWKIERGNRRTNKDARLSPEECNKRFLSKHFAKVEVYLLHIKCHTTHTQKLSYFNSRMSEKWCALFWPGSITSFCAYGVCRVGRTVTLTQNVSFWPKGQTNHMPASKPTRKEARTESMLQSQLFRTHVKRLTSQALVGRKKTKKKVFIMCHRKASTFPPRPPLL